MKRIIAMLGLLIGSMAAWPSAPAHAAPEYFQFRNLALTDSCLTLVGSAAHDGAWIGHYPCDGSDGQKWWLEPTGPYTFCVSSYNGQCLVYKTVDAFRIHSKVTNKCVDLSERSTSSGTRVHQWSCYNTDSQLWYFDSASTSEFRKFLSIRGENKGHRVGMEPRWDDPNKVQIWTANDETFLQRWSQSS